MYPQVWVVGEIQRLRTSSAGHLYFELVEKGAGDAIVGKLDFGPMFATVGDQTLWFAMLVAINLQTSFLTPPFGFALFYLKGVAPPNVQLGHLYRGIIPFVILQLIGLAIVFLFPELVTWLPKIALGRN